MSELEDYDDSDVSDVDDAQDESIRTDLAQTTFEELLGMRDKLGTKIYRDSVLKKLAKSNQDDQDDEQEDDEESESDGQVKAAKVPFSKKHQSTFKRSGKSCPIEASSKRLDKRHNFAILPTNPTAKLAANKAATFRDPRFDSQCGQFRADKFEKNYEFLNSMKKKELEVLQKQLRKAKTEEAKTKFSKAIRVLKSQLRTEQQKLKQRQVEKNVKTSLAKEINIEVGDRPVDKPPKDKKPKVFVNKATMKRAQLVEKFKELKKTGRLDKYLERKRKKNAGKERKYIENKF